MINNLRNYSLTLFLANACNRDLSIQERATIIRKCAKYLCSKVQDSKFKKALKTIRNTSNDNLVVLAVEKAEINYKYRRSLYEN